MRIVLPLFRQARQLSIEESKELRAWLSKFKLIEQRESYTFTFNKSSGPGASIRPVLLQC